MDSMAQAVYDAIVNGPFGVTEAVAFTQALAEDSWGEIAKLYHLLKITLGNVNG